MLLLFMYNSQNEIENKILAGDLYFTRGLNQEPVSKCLKQNKNVDMAFVFRCLEDKHNQGGVGFFLKFILSFSGF